MLLVAVVVLEIPTSLLDGKMSKSNTTENDLMLYTFNATAFSWNGSTDLYLALHTADPGEAGNQTTSEATYTSYARVAVARTSGGWTVTGNQAVNAALIQFPQATGGSNTITHVSIGTASSGAGQILYSGALSSSLSVTNGIQPQFAATSLTITED
jgi:hypothetical protein